MRANPTISDVSNCLIITNKAFNILEKINMNEKNIFCRNKYMKYFISKFSTRRKNTKKNKKNSCQLIIIFSEKRPVFFFFYTFSSVDIQFVVCNIQISLKFFSLCFFLEITLTLIAFHQPDAKILHLFLISF